jgi:hypothetical protein
MKRNLMLALAIGAMTMSTMAFANDKNPCGNNGNNCNVAAGGTGGQGGTAIAGAVGIGGAGGSVGDIKNTAMSGIVANSGNATIQNGAVRNTNLNANIGFNKNTNTATTGAITNTNSATGGSVGNITVNAYDPNAASENASATRDAAAISANTSTSYSGTVEIKTPGIASVPNIYPTSPCMGSTSAGVSFMGGAVSGGSSWKDDDCSYRETARMFDQLGYKKDGLAVMCESAYAKNAPSCKEIAAQQAAAEKKAADEKATKEAVATPVSTAPETDKRKTDATIKSADVSFITGG